MKHYQEKLLAPRRVKQVVRISCDLCGGSGVADWKEDSYDAADTTVTLRTGHNYPEGGGGEDTTIDICPKCFVEKLIPWVKSQGGEPTVTEWDW